MFDANKSVAHLDMLDKNGRFDNRNEDNLSNKINETVEALLELRDLKEIDKE